MPDLVTFSQDLLEKGLLPDPVIRMGIRELLRQKLAQEKKDGLEFGQEPNRLEKRAVFRNTGIDVAIMVFVVGGKRTDVEGVCHGLSALEEIFQLVCPCRRFGRCHDYRLNLGHHGRIGRLLPGGRP